jgi:hypothetical protein
MTAFTIAASSAVVIAISSCIIDDCLEWKNNIDVKPVLIKMIVLAVFLILVFYPFTKSYISDDFSGRELFLSYVFLFGYLAPMFGKFFSLMYVSLRNFKAGE